MSISWTDTTTGQFMALPQRKYIVLWHYTSASDYVRATIATPSQVPSHFDIKITQYAPFDMPASIAGLNYYPSPFSF